MKDIPGSLTGNRRHLRDWIDPLRLYDPRVPAGRSVFLWGLAIFPPLVEALLNVQDADGAFRLEPKQDDAQFGRVYTTSMAVLALTPAYQLLPVYQR